MKTLIWRWDKEEIISTLKQDTTKFVKLRKGGTYYNAPATFDIESTSTYIKGEKIGFMYEWTFYIYDMIIIGRTWDDFKGLCGVLFEVYELDMEERILPVYIHNLSYEFQFMCKQFAWAKVFALDDREPVKALTTQGIEFRCSYQLSGYNLATLANNLHSHNIKKLKGDLDYSLIRTSETPLMYKELSYCINDALIVAYYIEEQIEQYKDITKIPLTNTGRVRQYCRLKCLYNTSASGKKFSDRQYRSLMSALTLEVDEYIMLKQGFQGGFTHANDLMVGSTFENVSSYDFTSSYPAVMVAEKYPMSKGTEVTPKDEKEFRDYLSKYCCLFKISFLNIRARDFIPDNPIGLSKCRVYGKSQTNNGRIVWADQLTTVMTDVDFQTIERCYIWEDMRILDMYIYRPAYLPKKFIEAILSLYKDKTTLKGVEDKKVEYQIAKGMLNSLYGMCVTDFDKDTYTYGDEWVCQKSVTAESIERYNNDKKRFLFYPWGVWITAYARRNLFSGILAIGYEDYIYSDTDSLKILNADKHQDYFNKYNEWIKKKLYKCVDHYHLNRSLVEPKTIKGVKKLLGVWDYEGTYNKFKTLGAKRYINEKDGDLEITIAGLSKKAGKEYLVDTFKDKVFENFQDGLQVPADRTGKLTHTYIDYKKEGYTTDYMGNKYHVSTDSGIHLEPAPFEIGMDIKFKEWLIEVHEFKTQ